MGNAMFKFGSDLIDFLGFGVDRKAHDEHDHDHDHKHDDNDDDDDDCCDKDERVITKIEEMESYCKPLIFLQFNGQANKKDDTDSNKGAETFNIGVYLRELDAIIRQHPDPTKFDATDPVILAIIRKIADKRHRSEEQEEKCFKRLVRDAKRFTKIYRERAEKFPKSPVSEALMHNDYWGTRQQLLSGKVICDWLSEDDKPPMDPIFGVLMNPTAGRVGPGDSGWLHNILYDNSGEWAHHSAVHDAFGYLINFHEIGPGYNYMYRSFFDKDNPMAGQISGIEFWKKYVKEVELKLKVIENFKNI